MYINKNPNPSGAYSAPQSNKFPDSVALTDEQLTEFLKYNGFVNLTIEGETVTAITPNLTAWEEWKDSLPPETEPEPTELEKLRADIDYLSIMTGVTL